MTVCRKDALNANVPLSVIRVVFDFPPLAGGSSKHAEELSRKIAGHVKEQVIIAPLIGPCPDNCMLRSNPHIIRLPCACWIDRRFRPRLLGRIIVLCIFSILASREVRRITSWSNECVVLHVHGAMLAGMLTVLNKLSATSLPIEVTQHTANPARISVIDLIIHIASLAMVKTNKPQMLSVLEDGSGLSDYATVLNNLGIRWKPIQSAIDADVFKPPSTEDATDRFVVLSNSRLHHYKRIDLAILAFVKFLELTGSSSSSLLICGDGKDAKGLHDLVGGYPNHIRSRIVFLGHQEMEELVRIVQNSDVVIGTSLVSNMSRAIQEAMACERPVVAFNSGETSRLIDHMKNGVLVQAGDISRFAEMIKLLYEDCQLRREIGRSARIRIVETYSWDRRIQSELEAYRTLVLSRPPSAHYAHPECSE